MNARLSLLGGFELHCAEGSVPAALPKKARALLAFLAVSRGRAQSREKLAGLLWPRSSEAHARMSLRKAISAVRKALPELSTNLCGEDLEFVRLAPAVLSSDVQQFEALLADGSPAAREAALGLYRGELLEGFPTSEPDFELWRAIERERLHRLAVGSAVALLELFERQGELERAMEMTARAISLDPLREELHRTAMRLHARLGHTELALKQYRVCRALLEKELGVEPEAETDRLCRQLQEQRRCGVTSPSANAPSAWPQRAEAVLAHRDEIQPGSDATDSAQPIELRQAAILCFELSGLETAVDAEAETAHRSLVRCRETVRRQVNEHGGTLVGQIGTRSMAAFGIPAARSNDAERAVRAAFALREACSQLHAAATREPRCHIGIATGQVLCSRHVDGIHLTGPACQEAARIMAAAAPGEIWISHPVYDALNAAFDATAVVDAASLDVAEQPGPWRVEGFRRPGANLRPPFVGRRSQLRQLLGMLELTAAIGVGQAVLVRGEAGIGKSRLLGQLEQLAKERSFRCHKAQTVDFGAHANDSPLRALLHSLLDIDFEAPTPRRQAALERALETQVLLKEDVVFVNAAMDLPQPAELQRLYSAMDNETRQRGELGAFVNVMRRRSMQAPLLLVVEDIHWAAEDALRSLAALAVSARTCRVALALSARTEDDPIDASWRAAARDAVFSSIDLAPLSDAEATEMADHYRCSDAAFVRSCVERAQGNPLFLDQLLRSAGGPPGSLPASVHSIVRARIDRLVPHDRSTVEAAAVLGQRFSLPALQNLVESETHSCSRLASQGLIQSEGSEYRFVHALIREAVYASVLRSRRRTLHARAAQWFADRDPARQAEHLDAAGEAGAAAAYLHAARLDVNKGSLPRALRLCERGLQLAASPELRYELALLRAQLLLDVGRIDMSITAHHDALALASDGGKKRRALLGLAGCLRVQDRYQEALATLEQLETIGRHDATPAELVQLHLLRGNLYFPLGDVEACLASHQRANALAAQTGSAHLRASALGSLGDAFFLGGRMLSAHERYRRCIELADDEHLVNIQAAYLSMLGLTHLYRNELPQSRRICHAALELARDIGAFRAEIVARSVIWDTCLYAGEWEQAREHAECGLALASRVGARRFEAEAMFSLALALHALNVRHQPKALLDRARAISKEIGAGFCGPWICAVHAFVAKAPQARRRALAEGEELLEHPCVSHNHVHFYQWAIEAMLKLNDWEETLRYARRLESYTSTEPFPFADLVIRRGRLLARWGSGMRDDKTLRALSALRADASELGLTAFVPRVDTAIRAAAGSE